MPDTEQGSFVIVHLYQGRRGHIIMAETQTNMPCTNKRGRIPNQEHRMTDAIMGDGGAEISSRNTYLHTLHQDRRGLALYIEYKMTYVIPGSKR